MENGYILSLEKITEILSDRKYNLAEIARLAGLSYTQVWKAVKNKSNPPYNVVKTLSDYLQKTAGGIAGGINDE